MKKILKTSSVIIRVTPEQKEAISKMAKDYNLGVSALIAMKLLGGESDIKSMAEPLNKPGMKGKKPFNSIPKEKWK